MNLAAALVARFFESGPTVALYFSGREIEAAGYERSRPDWIVTGTTALAIPEFRFLAYTRFDEVVLLEGGRVIERFKVGDVQLPVGAVYRHEIEVQVV